LFDFLDPYTTTIYIIANSQVKTTVMLSLHAAYSLVVKNAGSRTIPGSDSYMYQADKFNLAAESSYNVMCAPICIPLALSVLPVCTTDLLVHGPFRIYYLQCKSFFYDCVQFIQGQVTIHVDPLHACRL
jgi:hypothetical protein